MNFEELLAYLELDDPSDFQYFEAMADLMESEEYIEPEAIYQLFLDADRDLAAAITEEYFEDILEGLPDDAAEVYSLLEQIKLSLAGMLTNAEDEDDVRKLADEVYRFRTWFSEESEVALTPETGGAELTQCLRDAITTARMEKLGGDRYRYDFNGALGYELDDYVVSFAELVAADGDESDVEVAGYERLPN